MKQHLKKLEDARKLHELLYEQFCEIRKDYEDLEHQIAALEGRVEKIAPRKPAAAKAQKPVSPKERLMAQMAKMSSEEKEAFIAEITKS
jgi:predicted  nucleic acid-binding Zn-ribbon protein